MASNIDQSDPINKTTDTYELSIRIQENPILSINVHYTNLITNKSYQYTQSIENIIINAKLPGYIAICLLNHPEIYAMAVSDAQVSTNNDINYFLDVTFQIGNQSYCIQTMINSLNPEPKYDYTNFKQKITNTIDTINTFDQCDKIVAELENQLAWYDHTVGKYKNKMGSSTEDKGVYTDYNMFCVFGIGMFLGFFINALSHMF